MLFLYLNVIKRDILGLIYMNLVMQLIFYYLLFFNFREVLKKYCEKIILGYHLKSEPRQQHFSDIWNIYINIHVYSFAIHVGIWKKNEKKTIKLYLLQKINIECNSMQVLLRK